MPRTIRSGAQKIGKYNLLAVRCSRRRKRSWLCNRRRCHRRAHRRTNGRYHAHAAVGSDALGNLTSIIHPARCPQRIGWLLLLFVAGTLTSAVLQPLRRRAAAVVRAGLFIPFLIGTAAMPGRDCDDCHSQPGARRSWSAPAGAWCCAKRPPEW